MRKFAQAAVAAIAVFSFVSLAAFSGEISKPADYPNQAVHWISPTPAGASVDLSTRAFTNFLDLGGSVVVENIGGGNQTIGAAEVAHRPADGYNILVMSNACGITQPLMNDVGYTIADFRHIAMLAPPIPCTIAVKADSPFRTIEDLIAVLQSDERYNFGVPNVGGYGHMAIFNALLQIAPDKRNGTMLSYNGSANTIAAILSDEVIFAVLDSTDAYAKVQNGELRVLSVLHNEVCPLFPDAALISNHGVKGTETFVSLRWVTVRKETPPEIVDWIKQQSNKVLANPEYQELLVRTGFGVMREYSEEEITAIVEAAGHDYGALMRATGIIE